MTIHSSSLLAGVGIMDAIMPGMTPGEEDRRRCLYRSVRLDRLLSKEPTFLIRKSGGMMAVDSEGYKIRVHCFDTAVYNTTDILDSDNMEDITEQYEIYGGGGTDFDCIFHSS